MVSGRTRMIIVDDEPMMLAAWRKHLRDAKDLEVIAILERADDLERHIPDDRDPIVVLLDLSMPGRDPLGAVRDIGRSRPNCRVVIYTGHGDAGAVAQAYAAGAWGFLSKLTSPADIIGTVRAVARGQTAYQTI